MIMGDTAYLIKTKQIEVRTTIKPCIDARRVLVDLCISTKETQTVVYRLRTYDIHNAYDFEELKQYILDIMQGTCEACPLNERDKFYEKAVRGNEKIVELVESTRGKSSCVLKVKGHHRQFRNLWFGFKLLCKFEYLKHMNDSTDKLSDNHNSFPLQSIGDRVRKVD